jgi:hypothetical protein
MGNDYIILRPENGGILDVLRFLFLSPRELPFIEHPELVEGRADTIYRRWIITVSILVRKFLHLVAKPMALVGFCIEFMLNLLSDNRGIQGIIFRVLTGRGIIIPERNSETFISAIGHLDPRLDLVKTETNSLVQHVLNGDYSSGMSSFIQVGSRSCADVCMMASKLAYENEFFIRNVIADRWKMHFVEFLNCWNHSLEKKSTKAFIFCDKPVDAKLVVVAFRGTEPFDADDWSTDFDFSWYQMDPIGKVHAGFLEAMGLADRSNEQIFKTHLEPKADHDNAGLTDEYATEDEEKAVAYYSIRRKLSRLLEEHKDAKFIVTGHSLGGALAILFPAILLLHKKTELMEKLLAVYTFGQPRIGDKEFGEFMNMKLNKPVTRYLRVVYCNDIVPRMPYDDKLFLFKHFGMCLYYNSCYREKTVEEEPNRNFSVSYFIPNMINATWELVHSLIMGYTRGEDFKEGWFSLLFRFMGIFLPGISAHSPVNYVNAIRLGPALIDTLDCDSDMDRKVRN